MAEKVTPVFAIASDITSACGMGVDAHWQAVQHGKPGIRQYNENGLNYYGSKLSEAQRQLVEESFRNSRFTAFEKLCLFSIQTALSQYTIDLTNGDTALILSTTKGNIDQLNAIQDEQIQLASSAEKIAKELQIPVQPIVISQACVSGSVALLYAHRLLSSGRYKNAIVTGCDLFTPFVLSGFMSFKAIAAEPCRPFDASRKGINLGEAAATVILSTNTAAKPLGQLLGGATSNDANHISGPSRTGEELAEAINRAMQEAGINTTDVNMVSAHGTATIYNDEMEAKALNLAGMSNTPVHSMKSYTGHTLGAAGVLESAMILKAMQEQQLIPSTNYETHGVPVPLNVTTQMEPATINYVLKTASGFGGSNAAIIWGKI